MKRDGRLHTRHPQAVLDEVHAIAKRRNITATILLDQFFQALIEEECKPKSDEELGIEQG